MKPIELGRMRIHKVHEMDSPVPLLSLRRDRGPRDCTCGHPHQAHEHYRRGTDCAMCACVRFRAGAPAAPAPQPRGTRSERAGAVRA